MNTSYNQSEAETRKDIDKQLRKAGWLVKYIKEEVNSVKSNFVNKEFELKNKTTKIERGKDRFIDYLLLAENNSPLAIIETKKFSKEPEEGRIQARTYSKDIETQLHEKIPIFLTNGNKWLFIDQKGIKPLILDSRNDYNPESAKIRKLYPTK